MATGVATTILVWSFYDAPPEYRRLSTQGGDEDGVVFVPNGVELPRGMERIWEYFEQEEHEVEGGTVIIWAH